MRIQTRWSTSLSDSRLSYDLEHLGYPVRRLTSSLALTIHPTHLLPSVLLTFHSLAFPIPHTYRLITCTYLAPSSCLAYALLIVAILVHTSPSLILVVLGCCLGCIPRTCIPSYRSRLPVLANIPLYSSMPRSSCHDLETASSGVRPPLRGFESLAYSTCGSLPSLEGSMTSLSSAGPRNTGEVTILDHH